MWVAFAVGLGVFAVILVMFLQQRGTQQAQNTADSPAGLVLPEQGRGTSLAAVGRLEGLGEPCTAWLVAVGEAQPQAAASPTASPADQPTASDAPSPTGGRMDPERFAGTDAYAVTTGRCAGITDSTTVMSGKAVTGATVGFNAFAMVTSAGKATMFQVPVVEVTWASARWLDLALLRLGATYGELAKSGVRPISPALAPEPGTQVLVAGVPVVGIPADQRYVRVARCQSGDSVGVLAGRWLWTSNISSGCAGMIGGSEGSPVFNPAGDALAMVNATTIDAPAGTDCYPQRPCEVTAKAVSFKANTTYLQPVADLVGCLASGQFRLGGSCALEDPRGVIPAATAKLSGAPGTGLPVALTGKVPASTKVADKQGPITATDCFQAGDYGRAVRPADWRMRIALPRKAGWVIGCVGSPEQPTPVIAASDDTAPNAADAQLRITEVEGGRQVEPVVGSPEYASFLWTVGIAGKIDCATAEGYTQFRGTPSLIQADDLPATVCLIAVDEAGNQSAPVAREVK